VLLVLHGLSSHHFVSMIGYSSSSVSRGLGLGSRTDFTVVHVCSFALHSLFILPDFLVLRQVMSLLR